MWSSPTAIVSKTVTTPADIHITNGEMITVAFVPKGTTIPGPVATTVTDLEDLLSGKAMTSTTTSTTTTTTSTLPPTSTTTRRPPDVHVDVDDDDHDAGQEVGVIGDTTGSS